MDNLDIQTTFQVGEKVTISFEMSLEDAPDAIAYLFRPEAENNLYESLVEAIEQK